MMLNTRVNYDLVFLSQSSSRSLHRIIRGREREVYRLHRRNHHVVKLPPNSSKSKSFNVFRPSNENLTHRSAAYPYEFPARQYTSSSRPNAAW